MAEHAHIDHIGDKRVALLIAVLALALALVETGGKSAQTEAITLNVQTTDLWAFFQARTIRQTVLRTATEQAEFSKAGAPDPATREAWEKQIKTWNDTIARWEDDPKSNEGRKQLMARARETETKRETFMAKYHAYEYAAALLQVAIVVASASIVTGVPALALGGVLLGLGGIGLGVIGMSAPEMLHHALEMILPH